MLTGSVIDFLTDILVLKMVNSYYGLSKIAIKIREIPKAIAQVQGKNWLI